MKCKKTSHYSNTYRSRWLFEETGERIEKEYADKFDSILQSLESDDDAVVIVDCHI